MARNVRVPPTGNLADNGAVGNALLHATFLFQLLGAPAGWVELRLEGDRFEYRSTHVIARDGRLTSRERSRSFEVRGVAVASSGKQLPALALWRKPSKTGCRPATGELSGQRSEERRVGDGG